MEPTRAMIIIAVATFLMGLLFYCAYKPQDPLEDTVVVNKVFTPAHTETQVSYVGDTPITTVHTVPDAYHIWVSGFNPRTDKWEVQSHKVDAHTYHNTFQGEHWEGP